MIKYKGAGILVYRITTTGRLEVLLARRRLNPGKNKWSHFGGGQEPSDKGRYRETAKREMLEELRIHKSWKKRHGLKFYLSTMPIQEIKIPFFFHYKVYAARVSKRIPTDRIKKHVEFYDVRWFDMQGLPRNLHMGVEVSVRSLYQKLQKRNKKG